MKTKYTVSTSDQDIGKSRHILRSNMIKAMSSCSLQAAKFKRMGTRLHTYEDS